MGGYGGSSGKTKDKCYRDTGGKKVTDKNAIAVAEYYIKEGKYVAFLKEMPQVQRRADLSVEGIHTEVKGTSSQNPSKIATHIIEGFEQVDADNYMYPSDTHRKGRVVILSKHSSLDEAKRIVKEGYDEAVRKGAVNGEVLMFYNGKMYQIN